jgi:hypothetical protein
MTRSPSWRRQLFFGGLLLLLLPPLGWPLALGYRKEVAFRLIEGTEPVLPDLIANLRACLLGGYAAAAVLLLYYLPFMVLFWVLGLDSKVDFFEHLSEIAAFFILIPFLIPLFLPLFPALYWYLFPWIHHSWIEILLLGIFFSGTAFVMPSVFLQVSLARSFKGAFRLTKALAFIRANLRTYLEAWIISLLATLPAFVILPLFFWLVFWSYLVIVYSFNEALLGWNIPEVTDRFRATRVYAKAISSTERNTG